MKALLTITSFILFWHLSLSQQIEQPPKNNLDFEIGEANFKRYSYRVAIKHYQKAYQKDSINNIIKLRLAQSYYNMRDMQDAEYWANLLLSGDYSPSVEQIYFYIEILASNQHYDEATYWYTKHIATDTTVDSTKKNRMRNFLNDPSADEEAKDLQIQPLNINSSKMELGPIFYKNGLVFSSGRRPSVDIKKVFKNDGIDYLKLYYSELDSNNRYKDPKIFDSHINSKYHQGPIAFFQDYQKVVFTQSSSEKRRFFGKRAGRGENGEVNLKLYMADYKNGTITNIKPFEYNSNEFSTGHATISDDGKKMIFSSNRPDAIGKSDLYICHKIGDNGWTPPINLGPKVNTTGTELFPYLHGNILYFSSDGHLGKGGLDIYAINLLNDIPQELSFLQYPINTPHDDFNLVTKQGRSGFFVTNRGNSLNDEIYMFEHVKELPPLVVNIIAYDSINSLCIKKPLLSVVDTSNNELVVPIKVKGDSIFTYVIEKGTNYRISINKPGYFLADSILFSGDSITGEIEWVIPLKKIKPNISIKIENIYYGFDKASLRDSSRIQLNELIIWLEDNPNVYLEISAHTDSRGNSVYNKKLSQRRAESVVDYLVESGINENRLIAKGYGKEKPIIDCLEHDCSIQDHQKNRRTEMKVIENTEKGENTLSPPRED